MKKREIQLSSAFKTQATKSIIAIGLFIFTYLIILLLAVGLTALTITGGFLLITSKPTVITIVLGVGLASLGILVLIFLVKFIFKSHKVDRSHLIEIDETQEPALFEMIDEVVNEVGTAFPKKVYISPDVNASVFYDSNFWSMFLPVQKNLQIGLGLVSIITKEELKAILAHEFGHFSQRTMKVGSYVYNVNQVIFNMLYDNESYENLIRRWANVNGFFSIVVGLAVQLNEGVQWVFKKMYEIVNINYMGLSREMEFHADEIAASITGYEPLQKALLRMPFGDNSYNTVLNFYNAKVSENIKSENIFSDQTALMYYIAETNGIRLSNNLPDITAEEQNKFDKSKLVIKDQWASHPTVEDRVTRLIKTGYTIEAPSDTLANSVFDNIDETQKRLTKKLFETVNYPGEPTTISTSDFIEEYKQEALSNSIANIYNGYYDNKNPMQIDLSQLDTAENNSSFEQLFSPEKVDLVYSALALNNDIETLKNISTNLLSVKTFDYDGVKYKRKNAKELAKKLEIELKRYNEKIKRNDTSIYEYFKKIESEQNAPKQLKRLYDDFFAFDKIFDSKYDIYIKLIEGLQFLNITTPNDEIRSNLRKIKPLEERLKEEINHILSDQIYTTEITKGLKDNLEKYISKTWIYFSGNNYYDENLEILYNAMENYVYLLSRKYFLLKNAILSYQEQLFQNQAQYA